MGAKATAGARLTTKCRALSTTAYRIARVAVGIGYHATPLRRTGDASPRLRRRRSHELRESGRSIFDLRAGKDPVDDVALDRQRFEILQPLRLVVVPAHDSLRLFVSLCGFLHEGFHLFGLRVEVVRAHNLCQY